MHELGIVHNDVIRRNIIMLDSDDGKVPVVVDLDRAGEYDVSRSSGDTASYVHSLADEFLRLLNNTESWPS